MGRELESLDSFLNMLYSLKTHMGEATRMLWTLASNHSFNVKSYYKTLQTGEPWSFWKVFGRLRLHPTLISLYGQQIWVESSWLITLKSGASLM
jgi:hypothetical protein